MCSLEISFFFNYIEIYMSNLTSHQLASFIFGWEENWEKQNSLVRLDSKKF